MPPQGGQPQYPPQYQQPYSPQGAPQYPQQYPPQGQPPTQGQPSKKSNTLMWVLIGVAVVIFVVVAGVSVGGYMLYRTVKNSGFDPDLMRKNPGLAMTKMMATLHPDMQVVSTDDANGTVTVRDKSTGKMLTFRWDPEKKSLVIVGDDGKEVKFSASGDDKSGSVTVESGDGTVKFGAGAGNSTPAWAPVYPGTTPQGTFSTQTGEGSQNTYTFKTRDPASKVLDYFKQQLTAAGFKVNVIAAGDQGGMMQAADESEKRSVMITAGTSAEGTEGSVTTIEKK
jgi:hypothetical protein